MSSGFDDAESTSEALEGTLTREIKAVSTDLYDDGRQVQQREIIAKEKAPEVSQKRLSKKVLWTIVSLAVLALAVVALAVGNLTNG